MFQFIACHNGILLPPPPQIEGHDSVSPLVAGLKSDVQEHVREGCGLGWESYKLENFVQKFSECIFNFQERVRRRGCAPVIKCLVKRG